MGKIMQFPKRLLIVVDMQKDFVTGVLGTARARAIAPAIAAFIRGFDGDRIYTKDTHMEDYLLTQEGKRLPVVHCVGGTDGWQLVPEIQDTVRAEDLIIEKPSFGSLELITAIQRGGYDEIYLVGVCTGICVISNAVIAKAADPEARIAIVSDLCGCVTEETHETALAAMRTLQMDVIASDQFERRAA